MMLMRWSFQKQVVAAEVMVMPRSLLLFHPVHRGGSFVYLADTVDSPCVVQDSLGRSRFARVDMRSDTDIACLF
jgi:hypothetical protein